MWKRMRGAISVSPFSPQVTYCLVRRVNDVKRIFKLATAQGALEQFGVLSVVFH
jgi:hypothetical protein